MVHSKDSSIRSIEMRGDGGVADGGDTENIGWEDKTVSCCATEGIGSSSRRTLVIRRRKYTCERCGHSFASRTSLVVHHRTAFFCRTQVQTSMKSVVDNENG